MKNNISLSPPTCPLCGDETVDFYACQTCEDRACDGCVGICEDCGDLVCSVCFVPDDEIDPWCPRCAALASPGSDGPRRNSV